MVYRPNPGAPGGRLADGEEDQQDNQCDGDAGDEEQQERDRVVGMWCKPAWEQSVGVTAWRLGCEVGGFEANEVGEAVQWTVGSWPGGRSIADGLVGVGWCSNCVELWGCWDLVCFVECGGGVSGGVAGKLGESACEFALGLGGVADPGVHQSHLVALQRDGENLLAAGAGASGRIDVGAASMTDAQQVRDTGYVSGEQPELVGGRPAEDGGARDCAATDLLDQDVVAAAGSEGVLRIADEPGSHGDLRGLLAERLEQAAALPAAIAGRLHVPAVRTKYELVCFGHVRLSPA